MSDQLISIAVGGAMTSLQLKRGLDLRQFGNANIVRSSLIEWSEHRQKWFIRLLHYHGRDVDVSTVLIQSIHVDWLKAEVFANDDTLYFSEYEDAVTVEVNVIQALRQLEGVAVV